MKLSPEVGGSLRHSKGLRGCSEGSRYGNRYFYKWWKKACCNLGVEGVDLYGGTRHSSAMALRQYRTPEEIKKATMHSTNKAFERYFQMGTEDIREIYGDTRATVKKQTNAVNFEPRKVIKDFQRPESLKALNLKDKNGGGDGSRTRVPKPSTRTSTGLAGV